MWPDQIHPLLAFLLPLAVFAVAGVNLYLLLGRRLNLFLSESIFLGGFLTTFLVFTIVWLTNISLSATFWTLSVAMLLLLVVQALAVRSRIRENSELPGQPWLRLAIAGALVVILFAPTSPLLIALLGTPPNFWDEFHQWNLHPKMLSETDDVVRSGKWRFPYLEYPPFFPLWSSFVSVVQGSLVEGAPRAVNLAVLLLGIVFVFEWITKQTSNIGLGLVAAASTLSLLIALPVDLVLDGRSYFIRSYVDGSTSLLFSLATIRLIDLFSRDKLPDVSSLFYGSAWISLVLFLKPVAKPLLVLPLLVITLLILSRGFKSFISYLPKLLSLLALPATTVLVHEEYLRGIDFKPVFRSARRPSETLFGDFGLQVFLSMWDTLTNMDKLAASFLMPLAILGGTGALLLVYAIVRRSWRKAARQEGFVLWTTSMTLLACLPFKAILLWIGYCLFFSEEEAQRLASFDRYLSYGIVSGCIGAVIGWHFLANHLPFVRWKIAQAALGIAGVLVIVGTVPTLDNNREFLFIEPVYEKVAAVSDDLFERGWLEAEEKIVCITQGEIGLMEMVCVYHLYPAIVDPETSFGTRGKNYHKWNDQVATRRDFLDYLREAKCCKVLVILSDWRIDEWLGIQAKEDVFHFIQFFEDGSSQVTEYSWMLGGNVLNLQTGEPRPAPF